VNCPPLNQSRCGAYGGSTFFLIPIDDDIVVLYNRSHRPVIWMASASRHLTSPSFWLEIYLKEQETSK
jgi:hypothetical protein